MQCLFCCLTLTHLFIFSIHFILVTALKTTGCEMGMQNVPCKLIFTKGNLMQPIHFGEERRKRRIRRWVCCNAVSNRAAFFSMCLRSGDFIGQCYNVPSCLLNKSHTDLKQMSFIVVTLVCGSVGVVLLGHEAQKPNLRVWPTK